CYSNAPAPTPFYTLSLHDALPISLFDRLIDTVAREGDLVVLPGEPEGDAAYAAANQAILDEGGRLAQARDLAADLHGTAGEMEPDRKSTRLNSSHVKISYAVFCLK